ncbi:MAG: hypothetical protein K8J31_26185, partial [Anaerolineae bacterium]|nr:hypothetical protein [Anaerolineae bacterium]
RQKFPPIQDALDRLWKLERERARLYREGYQSLLLEYDTGSSVAVSAKAAIPNGTNGQNHGT